MQGVKLFVLLVSSVLLSKMWGKDTIFSFFRKERHPKSDWDALYYMKFNLREL